MIRARLLLAGLALGSQALIGGVANIDLYCVSVRFPPGGVDSGPPLHYTAQVSRSDSGEADGELMLMPPEAPYSHGAYLRLEGADLFEPVFLPFMVNIPPFQDTNGNGVHDFFEVDIETPSTKTGGEYDDPVFGGGQIEVTWSRGVGSRMGVCRLELPFLGLTFNHPIEMIQFTGTLSYTNSGARITGWAQLKQKNNPVNIRTGPMSFNRVNSNTLQIDPGTWKDVANGEYSFMGYEPLDRDQQRYLAFFGFTDGDLETYEEDYQDWLLLITDETDGDRDGIPDLSDTPAPPSPFSISIQREPDAVLLTIAGEIGRTYSVHSAAELGQGGWSTQAAVTLTNANQQVSLPLPSTRTSFWRVSTQ